MNQSIKLWCGINIFHFKLKFFLSEQKHSIKLNIFNYKQENDAQKKFLKSMLLLYWIYWFFIDVNSQRWRSKYLRMFNCTFYNRIRRLRCKIIDFNLNVSALLIILLFIYILTPPRIHWKNIERSVEQLATLLKDTEIMNDNIFPTINYYLSES